MCGVVSQHARHQVAELSHFETILERLVHGQQQAEHSLWMGAMDAHADVHADAHADVHKDAHTDAHTDAYTDAHTEA